ncbi:MAG: TatD family hydrolase [Candidatus Levybacteria bacterium]|nr:TatD family hydrolase [Candidatus Levybacteria bacterium]
MVDVHCHLNFKAFEEDCNDVIKRAKKEGVEIIINTGTSLETSARAVELANQYDNLYAIVGIHPHHADKLEDGWEEKIRKIAQSKKVIGIGEIGLDYYSYKSNGIVDPKIQKEVFLTQIQIAYELNLPLQIHNRHAGEDIIEILKENKDKLHKIPGMFHCFAGALDVLSQALDLGFYIGFDGNITYKGLAPGETVSLPDLCRNTPIERILTETDAPFLSPEPKRGGRNEPSYVIITGGKIAEIKAISQKEVDLKTTQNAKTVFNI